MNKELQALRQVYECARKVLRDLAESSDKFAVSIRKLDAAVEKVKLIDSGLNND
jgi:hypothetical protein